MTTTNIASDIVAEIRKRHVPNPAVETYSCRWCGEGYPCETERAAKEIERLRKALAAAIGGFTCPHCGAHSASDLEDVHPAISVTCESCGGNAVVTIMTLDAYVRHCETERAARRDGEGV